MNRVFLRQVGAFVDQNNNNDGPDLNRGLSPYEMKERVLSEEEGVRSDFHKKSDASKTLSSDLIPKKESPDRQQKAEYGESKIQ